MLRATELSGTIGYLPLMGMLPEGLMRLAAVIGGHDFVRRHVVGAEPFGLEVDHDAPGAAAEGRRRRNARQRRKQAAARGSSARSCISPTVRLALENTRSPTGTLPASKRMTNGGTVPGGMKARARLT